MSLPQPRTKATILMPVYNGETHLTAAVNSILAQTFSNFTLLIIDDGSTDQTQAIIESFLDPRIKFIRNPQNLGLAQSLNIGISAIDSPYIVRMDSDDIAYPQRLERQINYMDAHPEIGLCGSYYLAFGYGVEDTIRKPPTAHSDILYELIFDNAFGHSTVVFRTELARQFNLQYNVELRVAQDYDLWVRMVRHCKAANIPEVLVRYRIHEGNASSRHAHEQRRAARMISEFHRNQIGLQSEPEDSDIHDELRSMNFPVNLARLRRAGNWLSRLLPITLFRCRQSPKSTLSLFSMWWYSACGRNASSGPIVFLIFICKPYGLLCNPVYTFKLLYRCLTKSPIGYDD